MTSGFSMTAKHIMSMSLIVTACGRRHGGTGGVAAKRAVHSATLMLDGMRLAIGSRPENTKLRLNSPAASLPWLSIGEAGTHITTARANINTVPCIC